MKRLRAKKMRLHKNIILPIAFLVILGTIIPYPALAQLIPQEELRQSFANDWNTKRYIYGVTEDGSIAIIEFSGSLGSSISAKPATSALVVRASRRVGTAVTATVALGLTLCPSCGLFAFSVLAGAVITENLGRLFDPLIADVFISQKISISGAGDVTDRVIALARANIVHEIRLRGGLSVSFIDPSVFSVILKDASGQHISKILGTDAILVNGNGESVFGLVSYNDPTLTGRSVTSGDVFGLDLSGVTTQPPGTNVNYEGMWMVVSDQRPSVTSNQFFTFTPVRTTFKTTSDTTGCPANDHFAGKFSFEAALKSKQGTPSLSFLQVDAVTLTNGVLQNADGGPKGERAMLTVPLKDDLEDSTLRSEESVNVPFNICLKTIAPFRLTVDLFADAAQ